MAGQSQSLQEKISRIADLHAELAVFSRETDREVKETARVVREVGRQLGALGIHDEEFELEVPEDFKPRAF